MFSDVVQRNVFTAEEQRAAFLVAAVMSGVCMTASLATLGIFVCFRRSLNLAKHVLMRAVLLLSACDLAWSACLFAFAVWSLANLPSNHLQATDSFVRNATEAPFFFFMLASAGWIAWYSFNVNRILVHRGSVLRDGAKENTIHICVWGFVAGAILTLTLTGCITSGMVLPVLNCTGECTLTFGLVVPLPFAILMALSVWWQLRAYVWTAVRHSDIYRAGSRAWRGHDILSASSSTINTAPGARLDIVETMPLRDASSAPTHAAPETGKLLLYPALYVLLWLPFILSEIMFAFGTNPPFGVMVARAVGSPLQGVLNLAMLGANPIVVSGLRQMAQRRPAYAPLRHESLLESEASPADLGWPQAVDTPAAESRRASMPSRKSSTTYLYGEDPLDTIVDDVVDDDVSTASTGTGASSVPPGTMQHVQPAARGLMRTGKLARITPMTDVLGSDSDDSEP